LHRGPLALRAAADRGSWTRQCGHVPLLCAPAALAALEPGSATTHRRRSLSLGGCWRWREGSQRAGYLPPVRLGRRGRVAHNCQIAPPLPTHSKHTAPLGPFCSAGTKGSVGSAAHLARLVLATIGPPASHDSMKSRPAAAVRRSRHEDAEPMTADQRLAESHCQFMAQLANSEVAGQWASARRLSGSITAWAEPTRPTHGLSQRYVNRVNGCLDCRPHLRPSVRMPAALHGHPVPDSPGMG